MQGAFQSSAGDYWLLLMCEKSLRYSCKLRYNFLPPQVYIVLFYMEGRICKIWW